MLARGGAPVARSYDLNHAVAGWTTGEDSVRTRYSPVATVLRGCTPLSELIRVKYVDNANVDLVGVLGVRPTPLGS